MLLVVDRSGCRGYNDRLRARGGELLDLCGCCGSRERDGGCGQDNDICPHDRWCPKQLPTVVGNGAWHYWGRPVQMT